MVENKGAPSAAGGLVSVIIPFFNRAQLLGRALGSVIDQTYRDLEIILVDDGSEEDCEAVLGKFIDPRIVRLRHERNQGVSAARNTGIAAAHGAYIAFLDSDDEWLPTKVEKQLASLARVSSDAKVSYCYSQVVSDETGAVLELNSFHEDGDVLHSVLMGSGGSPGWTGLVVLVNEIMASKEDLAAVGGFDRRFRMHEDWEFIIRLASRYGFVCVPEVLVRNHKHKLGHLGDKYQDIPEVRRRMLEAHRELYQRDRLATAAFHAELAYYQGVNGQKGQAMLSLFRSMANSPFRKDPYMKMMLLLGNRLQKPRTEWR